MQWELTKTKYRVNKIGNTKMKEGKKNPKNDVMKTTINKLLLD